MKRRDFLLDSAGLIGACVPVLARAQAQPCPPDVLSVTGGQTVSTSCAESPLPSWVPSPGTFANISLNTPSAVDPCPAGSCVYSGTQGQNAVFTVWTSGIYAPELGSYGSYVAWGGGHKAYAGNEVYRFDVSSRVWSRLGTPSPYNDSNVDSSGAFPDGKPAPPHNFQTLGIRSSSHGGGASGSLIQATNPGANANGDSMSDAWWQFNLAASTWSKFIDSSSIEPGSLAQKVMVQEPDSHYWWFGNGYIPQIARVTQTGVVTKYNITLNSTNATSGGVLPGSRIAVLNGPFDYDAAMRLLLVDLKAVEGGADTGTATKFATFTGTPPGGNSGLQWCPILGRFAAMATTTPTKIYWLTPPADPWRGTWVWSTETLTPASGTVAQTIPDGIGSYNRFAWCPPIRSFFWATGRNNPMQAYRPMGT